MAQIDWLTEVDEDDNDNWIVSGASPYTVDEDPLYWRLRPIVKFNQVYWRECHDVELIGSDGPKSWPSLEEAKWEIQKAHDSIINELMSDVE